MMSKRDTDTLLVVCLLIIALAIIAADELIWPLWMATSIQELVRGG